MRLRNLLATLPGGGRILGTNYVGVRGDLIPQAGDNGAALAANDVTLPADSAKGIRVVILTHNFPAGTFKVFEDTSFQVVGAPNGVYSGTYRLEIDGVPAVENDYGLGVGVAPFSVAIGAVDISATVTLTEGGDDTFGASALVKGDISAVVAAIEANDDVMSADVFINDAIQAIVTLDEGSADDVFEAIVSIPATPVYRDIISQGTVWATERVSYPPGVMTATTAWRVLPVFTAKHPDETIFLEFDFSKLVKTVLNAAFSVVRCSGTPDTDPQNLIEKFPVISGGKVKQRFKAGINGADYVVTCSITSSDGHVIILSAILPVRT